MLIRPYLRDQPYDPELLEAMEFAFVTICEALALSNRTDAMNQRVADKIVALAESGMRNPTALRMAAMREFFPKTSQRRKAR